jgi:deazaflavin-dependent oxidoreductase (nitroreductase family)
MPLPYADPDKLRQYKALNRFGRSKVGQFLARHVMPRIDPWLFRVSRGRYPSRLPVITSAPLVMTGAKSGERLQVQVGYFHDGPDPILIASNYGKPKHPQWYHNLKAHPECSFGDDDFIATEVTDPTDYDRLFGIAEQVFPGYADYRAKTAAAGRKIPIFRLKPR